MLYRILLVGILINIVTGADATYSIQKARRQECSRIDAILKSRNGISKFSLNIFNQALKYTNDSFVFSPISAWLQLLNIVEGARYSTRNEIQRVTGISDNLCVRKHIRDIFNGSTLQTKGFNLHSLFLVDQQMALEIDYEHAINQSSWVDVLKLDFNQKTQSAEFANEYLKSKAFGLMPFSIVEKDFNLLYFLLYDFVFFKSVWKFPFDVQRTTKQEFYGRTIGFVDMMNQVGVFKLISVPSLKMDILEIPCDDKGRYFMLLFLPTNKNNLNSLFGDLKSVYTIFRKLKKVSPKVVDLSLPKFELENEFYLPNLLNDMGIRRMFYLDNGDLKGISKYKLNVSGMTQFNKIVVDERGGSASNGPDYLINEADIVKFKANRPFAYMIVDDSMDLWLPLFAGIYYGPERSSSRF